MLRAAAGGVLALLLVTTAVAAAPSTAAPAPSAAQGDFAGLVDIGGRRLYLECRGAGSPTVVLEDGAGLGADMWSVDFLEPAGSRSMVLPAVAGFTRGCAYDRPGIVLAVNPAVSPLAPADRPFPSRSDPAPMPRSANQPLRPLPLAILTHGRPFAAMVPNWPGEAFERMWLGMQQDLAGLVPHSRFTVASQSGHAIHQDQPALVS